MRGGGALAAAVALWRRDLLRLGRQPARLIGVVGQPLVFLALIGGGMAGSFRLPAAPGVGYPAYFFPGVLVMVALFSSIFAGASVIEDRHRGFLQAVALGPVPAWAVVVGKVAGASSVALAQVAGFVGLMPLVGLPWGEVAWGQLAVALALVCVGFAALGLALAWPARSVQGFHAVQMLGLVPAWVTSGAMFPPPPAGGALGWLMAHNPIAFLLAGVRHALHGGQAPAGVPVAAGPGTALAAGGVGAVVAIGWAVWAVGRREGA